MKLLSVQRITRKIIYLENISIDAQKKINRYLQENAVTEFPN